MKNYVTQKMRGIRRMVWFWSWLVVMLAMTEVSWGQGIPLYAEGEENTPPIGKVLTEVDDTKTVYFTPVFDPGFANDGYLNITSVSEEEYPALLAGINNGSIKFKIEYVFAPINSAEALGNILRHCANSEDAVSYSGNTVTVSEEIEFAHKHQGNLNFIGGSPITLHIEKNGNVREGNGGDIEATLSGANLTITGEYFLEDRCDINTINYNSLWRIPVTINSGSLKIQNVRLWKPDSSKGFLFSLNEGNLEISNSYLTSNIEQNGGELIFNNVYLDYRVAEKNAIEMNGGSFIINNGYYVNDNGNNFLHITGDGAEVEIKDGHFVGMLDRGPSIYQQAGKLTIENGLFQGRIAAEKGTLDINDILFISEGLDILGDANITLHGGKYISRGSSVSIPANLLATGYGFYTCYQEIQPDIRLSEIKGIDTNWTLWQVKPISTETSTNNCIEAAKTANIGPNGTDVKVVSKTVEDITYYDYEVYTEKGLAWIATACNQFEYGFQHDLNIAGKEYSQQIHNLKTTIKLMDDMNMSEYDWIPFAFYGGLFDGQGYSIKSLNVAQKKAAFISAIGNLSTLANLIIEESNFNSIETDYVDVNGHSYAAGLIAENRGNIINCGVQESSINCTTEDVFDAYIGGIAGVNRGTIENSYITGDVHLSINHSSREILSPCGNMRVAAAGFVGDNTEGGSIINSYYAGGSLNIESNSTSPNVEIFEDEFAVNYFGPALGQGSTTNCTTSPELESLNNNVAAHVTPEGGIAWKKWTTVEGINMGYPIHGENAVSAGKLTILSEGPGEFKGSYGEETFVADTTVSINGASELKLTATPDEGSTLLKVVSIRNNAETVIAGVDAGQAFAYTLSSVSDTLKAYFGNPDMIIEEAMTVSGHTNGQNIVIDVPETAVLDFENVVIDNAAPKTTVKANSEVIIRLSGANNLGTLLNEGTTILQSEDESASLIADIENNGIFSDETGMITSVSGPAALEIEPLSDYTIEEGETVTLSVTVYAEENSNLDFQWLRKEGNEWIEIIPTRSIEVSSTLEVREAGLYRCLITNTVDGVMTVLNAYSEVEIAPAYEPEYPDIPEEPVANEAIAEDETRVHTQEGKIIVVTPNPQEVQIVSMNGSVIATAKVAGQQAFDGMNEGTYIVRVGEDVIKIRLKL
jgi:hypothetical protein